MIRKAVSLTAWFLGFAGLWWIISEGRADGLWLALPAAALALAVRQRLDPIREMRLNPAGVAPFILLFLWLSLKGGADVALRAVSPRPALAPAFFTYHTTLRREAARVLFVRAMCLLPGTFGASLDGNRISIHVLDERLDAFALLRRLEAAVARVFGDVAGA